MKIDIDQHNNLRLKEVFSGILFETEEGNAIGVCMRDDTLEINVLPGGENSDNWWRVNMQTGSIENMKEKCGAQVPSESNSRDRLTEPERGLGASSNP